MCGINGAQKNSVTITKSKHKRNACRKFVQRLTSETCLHSIFSFAIAIIASMFIDGLYWRQAPGGSPPQKNAYLVRYILLIRQSILYAIWVHVLSCSESCWHLKVQCVHYLFDMKVRIFRRDPWVLFFQRVSLVCGCLILICEQFYARPNIFKRPSTFFRSDFWSSYSVCVCV